MMQFLRLIEVARRIGLIEMEPQLQQLKRPLTAQEWDAIEACHPFVFHDLGAVDDGGLPGYQQAASISKTWVQELDAPFPVFSLELLSDHQALAGAMDGDELLSDFLCIVTIEESPRDYSFLSLVALPNGNLRVTKCKSVFVGSVVKASLRDMSTQALGMETVRQSVKLGSGQLKRSHRIKMLIHVAPKSDAKRTSLFTKQIDWSHRFEVRGHWRKIDTLGKDRNGDYTVSGFTWVTHHVRGPEHLPLIKKTRLVANVTERT